MVDNIQTPEEEISIVSSDGSQQGTIPKSSYQIAKSKGWKAIGEEPPTPEEEALKTEAEKAYNAPPKATLNPHEINSILGPGVEIASRKFINELTFGAAAPLANAGETEHQKAVREAEENIFAEKHPVANVVAPAAGFGASLLVPGIGEVGHLAEGAVRGGEELAVHGIADAAAHTAVDQTAKESIGRLITGKIAGNIAQAEAYSLPSQVVNLAVGDPDSASESLLWSLGLGGVLGFGSLARVGLDKLGESGLGQKLKEGAGELADKLALKQNLKEAKMNPFEKDQVLNLQKEKGLFGEKLSSETKENLRTELGDVIDEHRNYLDQKAEELNDQKIPDRRDALGNAIPSNQITNPLEARLSDLSAATVDKPGPNGVHEFGPNPTELADRLEADVNSVRPGLLNNPLHKSATTTFNDTLEFLRGKGNEPLSFSDWNTEIKRELDSKAGFEKNVLDVRPTAEKELSQLIVKKAAEYERQEANKVFIAAGEPDKMSEYLKSTSDYNAIKTLQKKKLQLPERNNGIAPSGLGQHAGLMNAGVALFTGHPHAAAALLVAHLARPALEQIAKRNVLPYAIRGLKKAAEANYDTFGSMLGMEANNALDKHLQQIGPMLTKAKTIPTRSINPLSSFLGGGVGQTKDQQYKNVTNSIMESAADPSKIASEVGKLTQIFGQHPELQHLIIQKNMNALQYLNSIVPKNPNPPQAFGQDEWQPSDKQKKDFLNQLAIVDDPMVAVEKIANGTITSKDIATVKNVYPAVYQKISNEIMKTAFSPEGKSVDNATIIASSKWVGQPLIKSLKPENMNRDQQSFAIPPPQQAPNGSAPSPKHTNKDLKEPKMSMQTNVQRIANK